MSTDLKGKVAVITGASRGIGRAAALALAREGVHVVLVARTESDLNQLKAEVEALGVRALVTPADVAKEEDVQRVKEAALAEFGQVDILVNNAGVGRYATILETSPEEYDWMTDTNMRGTFLLTRAFLPETVELGIRSIISETSTTG